MTRDSESKKYWAFISYSSKDKKWGSWLHKRLENYPIPKEFQKTELFDGAILGKNLRPVFRDRDELAGSSELGPAIFSALEQSRYLIVLCSKNSAQSEWVNKEIEDFKDLDEGNAKYILALILDGEPNATSNTKVDDSEECFPPALRYPLEPLAGDLRKEGDGKERGFLKVLSGVAQLDFDTLYRRHERAQRKKRLFIGGVAACVIFMLAGLLVFALSQKKLAEEKTAEVEAERSKTELELMNSYTESGKNLMKDNQSYDAIVKLLKANSIATKHTKDTEGIRNLLQQAVDSNYLIHQFRPHDTVIDRVEFSADSKYLCSVSVDRDEFAVWSTENWQKVYSKELKDLVYAGFTKDGQVVSLQSNNFVGGDGFYTTWSMWTEGGELSKAKQFDGWAVRVANLSKFNHTLFYLSNSSDSGAGPFKGIVYSMASLENITEWSYSEERMWSEVAEIPGSSHFVFRAKESDSQSVFDAKGKQLCEIEKLNPYAVAGLIFSKEQSVLIDKSEYKIKMWSLTDGSVSVEKNIAGRYHRTSDHSFFSDSKELVKETQMQNWIQVNGLEDYPYTSMRYGTGSAQSELFATSDGGTIYVSAKSNKFDITFRNKSPVKQLKMSPDGQVLCSVNKDGYIEVWQMDQSLVTPVNAPGFEVSHMESDAQSDAILMRSNSELCIYNTKKEAVQYELKIEGGAKFNNHDWFPYSNLLVISSSSDDKIMNPSPRTVRVYDTLEKKLKLTIENSFFNALLPDGKSILVRSNKKVLKYDLETGTPLVLWDESNYESISASFVFRKGVLILVTPQYEIQSISLEDGRILSSYKFTSTAEKDEPDYGFSYAKLSRDERYLLLMSSWQSGLVWDFDKKEFSNISYKSHYPEIYNFDFTGKIIFNHEVYEKGKTLRSIKIQKFPSFTKLHSIPVEEIANLYMLDSNRVVVAESYDQFVIVDVNTGEKLKRFSDCKTYDEDLCVLVCEVNNNVEVWNLKTMQMLNRLPIDYLSDPVISSDSKYLYYLGRDHKVYKASIQIEVEDLIRRASEEVRFKLLR